MYILIAILSFGILIFVHEMGHFIAAKSCGVKVLEFAMGMGPQILHRQVGETDYSLRLLPIGGFCAMEGEDEDSDDPRSFSVQPLWKKLIILVAGAFMNFLLGFLITALLFVGSTGFFSNRLDSFREGCPYEGTLQAGDRIHSVNGERVFFSGNFSEYVGRNAPDGRIDLVIIRDGRRIEIDDYYMVPVEYPAENGGTEWKYGINFAVEPNNFATWLRYSWYNCLDFVRLVRIGLTDLITGNAAVTDMAGVVGIVDIINETGQNAATVSQGLSDIAFMVALIAVNLAVMNMLPIPALDGGHVLTLCLSALWTKITGCEPDTRIENWIHSIGLMLLMLLMVFIMYNDISRILSR